VPRVRRAGPLESRAGKQPENRAPAAFRMLTGGEAGPSLCRPSPFFRGYLHRHARSATTAAPRFAQQHKGNHQDEN